MIKEPEHQPMRALTSASNMHRRIECPGSENAERGMPEIASKNATEGTMLHEVEFLADEDEESSESQKWDLNRWQKAAIEKNKRLTDGFIASAFAKHKEWNPDFDPGEPVIFKEREFVLCDENREPIVPLIPGHTDIIYWYPKVKIAFVFDSKFGRIPVAKAEINYQLRTYFIMIWDELEPDYTYVAIRQPFLPEPENFHSAVYPGETITEFRKELLDALKKCKDPDAERVMSMSACMYCRARGTGRCIESLKFVRDVSRHNTQTMRPSTMEEFGKDVMLAKIIIKGWEEKMRYIAERFPEVLKYFKLGNEEYTHSFPDVPGAFEALFANGVLGENKEEAYYRFMKATKPSITGMADIVKSQRGLDNEKDAKAVLFRILGRTSPDDMSDTPLVVTKPKQRRIGYRKFAKITQ